MVRAADAAEYWIRLQLGLGVRLTYSLRGIRNVRVGCCANF